MSETTVVDLYVAQGEDYSAQIYWYDAADSPWQIRDICYMEIITAAGDSLLKLSSATASGWIVGLAISGQAGFIQINITEAQTSALDAGVHEYELYVKYATFNSDGVETGTKQVKLLRGAVIVEEQKTSIP